MKNFLASALGGTILMFVPVLAQANTLTVPVGTARATLQLQPDPPRAGTNHAVISLSGASSEALTHTTASFSTVMPSMAMNGPTGPARQTGPGRWEFDAMLGMAAAWDIKIQFSGAITGAATYHINIRAAKASQSASASTKEHAMSNMNGAAGASRGGSMAGMSGMSGPGAHGDSGTKLPGTSGVAMSGSSTATTHGGSMSGMAGMGGMAGAGDPSSEGWKTAAIALFVIVIVGGVAFGLRPKMGALFAFLAVAAVAIVGLALLQAHFFHANPAAAMSGLTSDMSSMADVHGSGPIPVTVAKVAVAGQADPNVSAPGSVQPYLTQDIVARAPGLLSDFNLYAGDRVSAGQTIARLDEPELGSRASAAAADAQAQQAAAAGALIEAHHHAPNGVIVARDEAGAMQRDLDAAHADVSAKDEHARYWRAELAREHQLLASGAVSEQEFTDERAQAAAADSALVTARDHVASVAQQLHAMQTKVGDARADVEIMTAKASEMQARAAQAGATASVESTMAGYRNVIAPSDGVIVKRMVDPGVYVQPGTVIARVAVIDRLRVQANVSQDRLSGISVGTPLQAALPGGHIFRGRVSSIQPVADPTTHTTTVEAIVENPTRMLVPGGFVNVTLHAVAMATRGTMQVPSAAIVGAGTDAAVWAIVDGAAHRVAIKVESDDGTMATIEGQLARGAHVAIEGASTLEEGQVVAPRGVQ